MNIGKVIYINCDDHFDEYSNGTKTIIAEGFNWIVCIDGFKGKPEFASFDDEKDKQREIDKWFEANKYDEDED